MALTDEILNTLKDISKNQSIEEKEGFTSGSAIIEVSDVEEVKNVIEAVLDKYYLLGEEIVTKVDSGEIKDTGKAYFKILGGYIFEFYHYEKMSSLFIRIYQIMGGEKKWIAVYLDENTNSPWWPKEV